MKKIKLFTVLILIIVFLLSLSLVSCNKQKDESSTKEQTSTSSFDSDGLHGCFPVKFSSKKDVLRDWEGKTLNVLATRYEKNPTAPWGQLELNPYSFGTGIGKAYDERQAKIKELYGVEIDWISSQSYQFIAHDLATAEKSEALYYDIAIPRVTEAQALVSSVYNMRLSDYLSFENDYFSVSAYEDAFTNYGYTLFISGDHDFSTKLGSYALIFNKKMLKQKAPEIDIYNEVKNGTWTYDKFKSIASLVSTDGEGDLGTYGVGISDITSYYYSFGIYEVDIDPDTGTYRYAFGIDKERLDSVIAIMKEAKGSLWTRDTWANNSIMDTAFVDGRLMFYNGIVQKIDELKSNFDIGVVPFPKLNAEQTSYITPLDVKTTVLCIPRVTQDRQMSEYFIDVLSWTGKEYTVKAYYDSLKESFNEETANEDMQILQNYVFKNIKYDVGYLTGGSICGEMKQYILLQPDDTTDWLAPVEIVQSWNNAWVNYDGDKEYFN